MKPFLLENDPEKLLEQSQLAAGRAGLNHTQNMLLVSREFNHCFISRLI